MRNFLSAAPALFSENFNFDGQTFEGRAGAFLLERETGGDGDCSLSTQLFFIPDVVNIRQKEQLMQDFLGAQ